MTGYAVDLLKSGARRAARIGATAMLAASAALWSMPGFAEDASSYPNRPVRLIVPWPVGGATDVMARIVAEKLSTKLGQPLVVENKPGATGYIGTQQVIQAAPDGYTLLAMAASLHSFTPSVARTMPFDPVAGITPVSVFVTFPSVLAVPVTSPFKTVGDLVEAARAAPGKLTFGSSGTGSAAHLIPELLATSTGVQFLHVPYKGAAPALTDLMGGQITFVIDSIPSPLPQVRNGRLKALAVTSAQRSAALPGVPTIAETMPGFEAIIWLGIGGPPGLPSAIADKLCAALREIARDPAYIAQVEALGANAAASESPQAFKAFMTAQRSLWEKVVADAKIPKTD